ncbi:YitT family protein [Sinobaca sp. H24]|uniref:YitT family protein n=1 Tax=Sinobaca sp. H24 TaxID=2923376 RepID=UPI00207A940A|nr:YitT family protein [Sinobaca sp. H24]
MSNWDKKGASAHEKYIVYIIGTLLFAVSVTQLAMPNSIAEGGIIGAALLIFLLPA